ncbi:hypothetical protein [Streptomyces sp. NPDC059071]|uniref:hypothetical protein n=1 Tax=unclassified Streptomyces TaxID=2593676 RepID=UPI0036302D70
MVEAVDSGGGAAAAAYGMVPLVGGAAAAMAYEVTELTKLQQDVDELLRGFKESGAGPQSIGEDWIVQGALAGPGFHEAEYLYSTYDVVRTELLMFSRVLSLQLESMKIAIALAKTGYEDIDDDIRARMGSLNAQITELQRETLPPAKARRGKAGSDDAGSQGESAQNAGTPAEDGTSQGY